MLPSKSLMSFFLAATDEASPASCARSSVVIHKKNSIFSYATNTKSTSDPICDHESFWSAGMHDRRLFTRFLSTVPISFPELSSLLAT